MIRALIFVALAAAIAAPAQTAETCDRQIVMRIDSAQVTVNASGVTIDAFGVAESAGWSKPTIVVTGTDGSTATADYVGCRPEVSAQVLTPVYTRTTVTVPAAVTKIVIRTKTNSMEVFVNRN